jgi:hypothetical protein
MGILLKRCQTGCHQGVVVEIVIHENQVQECKRVFDLLKNSNAGSSLLSSLWIRVDFFKAQATRSTVASHFPNSVFIVSMQIGQGCERSQLVRFHLLQVIFKDGKMHVRAIVVAVVVVVVVHHPACCKDLASMEQYLK